MGERGALSAQPASGADPGRALGGEEGCSHIWVSGARSCCHGAGRLLGRGGWSQVDVRDICGRAGGLAGRVGSSLGGAVFLLALGSLLQALG